MRTPTGLKAQKVLFPGKQMTSTHITYDDKENNIEKMAVNNQNLLNKFKKSKFNLTSTVHLDIQAPHSQRVKQTKSLVKTKSL